MKRVYWRPTRVSENVLSMIAALSLAGLFLVESFPTKRSELYYQQMLEASMHTRDAMEVLKRHRLEDRVEIHPVADPTQSGLIGVAMSEITTTHGSLPAKQTTINPNWAAVIVHLLHRAGVRVGDTIAVGLSGSFPALNLAVYMAAQTLELDPIVIASASASQWGANHPRFTWLDMEEDLHHHGIISFRAVAASLGGVEDQALRLSDDGVKLLMRAIRRNGRTFFDSESYAESVTQRMAIYREHAGDAPIRAYVNVGGSTASVGTSRSKYEFQPGLNLRPPPKASIIDSVMARFLSEGVPVIHLLQIEDLAMRYGLPIQPLELPPVGSGQVFLQRRYNAWLAGGVLALVVASLLLFVRSGRGRLVFQRAERDTRDGAVEPTV